MDQRSQGQPVSSYAVPAAADVDDLFPQEERYERSGQPICGGMGAVFPADDKKLQRKVAIKRILPEYAKDKAVVERFTREALSLAKLQHPNIVHVLDLAEDQHGPYLVMQWIEGESIAEKLKRSERLDAKQSLQWIASLCVGLQLVHDLEMIHRDIKPANILINEVQQPVLIDFGLARLELGGPALVSQTVEGTFLGTMNYVSPEQEKDPRNVTALSDQWSLAATLYQMLTGYTVKARDDELIPEAVRATLAKALKPRPADRFDSIEDFGKALRGAMLKLDSESDTKVRTKQPARDPNDLADLLKRTQESVAQRHAQAKFHIKDGNYAEAAEILEGIPAHLRDTELAESAVVKRDRAELLSKQILEAVKAMRLDGVREQVLELLDLQPNREDLGRLLEQLPEEPAPEQVLEEKDEEWEEEIDDGDAEAEIDEHRIASESDLDLDDLSLTDIDAVSDSEKEKENEAKKAEVKRQEDKRGYGDDSALSLEASGLDLNLASDGLLMDEDESFELGEDFEEYSLIADDDSSVRSSKTIAKPEQKETPASQSAKVEDEKVSDLPILALSIVIVTALVIGGAGGIGYCYFKVGTEYLVFRIGLLLLFSVLIGGFVGTLTRLCTGDSSKYSEEVTGQIFILAAVPAVFGLLYFDWVFFPYFSSGANLRFINLEETGLSWGSLWEFLTFLVKMFTSGFLVLLAVAICLGVSDSKR